jgi:hypothetical protein
MTDGQCEFLDVNNDKGTERLLELFITNILKMVGKVSGDLELGKKMAAEYMSFYT